MIYHAKVAVVSTSFVSSPVRVLARVSALRYGSAVYSNPEMAKMRVDTFIFPGIQIFEKPSFRDARRYFARVMQNINLPSVIQGRVPTLTHTKQRYFHFLRCSTIGPIHSMTRETGLPDASSKNMCRVCHLTLPRVTRVGVTRSLG